MATGYSRLILMQGIGPIGAGGLPGTIGGMFLGYGIILMINTGDMALPTRFCLVTVGLFTVLL
jgi:hypothetical protein